GGRARRRDGGTLPRERGSARTHVPRAARGLLALRGLDRHGQRVARDAVHPPDDRAVLSSRGESSTGVRRPLRRPGGRASAPRRRAGPGVDGDRRGARRRAVRAAARAHRLSVGSRTFTPLLLCRNGVLRHPRSARDASGGGASMLNRRDFLRTSAALGAGTVLGSAAWEAEARRLRGGSILDLPAADAPIDTVVVLMMENRSFDHYLGWLGTDEAYLDEGRLRWGSRFRVEASTDERYTVPDVTRVPTYPLLGGTLSNPWRGCGHPDPDHGWDGGRVQRDHGFLAAGQGSDQFALGWYGPEDLSFDAAFARRFTIFDRYHCSVLGPTYPNREYLHSGQSGGLKRNFFPNEVGYPQGFTWPTVWDRMTVAGVPARYYYTDLPVTALWGARLTSISSPIAR